MAFSIGSRSFLAAHLNQTSEAKASHRSELDVRVAGLRTQMETHSSTLRDREFKSHFVKQLIDSESVQALLDKCYQEAATPEAARKEFLASMLIHVQEVVGARPHRTDTARQTQVDETMEELMGQLAPSFKGLKEGTAAKTALVDTCTTAMATAIGVDREFTSFLSRSVEHRDDSRKSTDSTTLMRAFRDECKRRSRDTTEPFFELWKSSCIAEGRMIDPQTIKHELFEKVSKQLLSEKGYSPEDAAKKAWHLVQDLCAPAEAAITSEIAYLSNFVLALGANPDALYAFHHQEEAAAALSYALPSGEVPHDRTRLILERNASLQDHYNNTLGRFSELVQRHLVKETKFMRTSYTPTETVLTNLLRDDPEIVKTLVKNCLKTLIPPTASTCQLEITQRILVLLQKIDPEYYKGDKGLDKAQHFYRALMDRLPSTGTDSFDDMCRMVTAEGSAWIADPSLVESFKFAKKLVPFLAPEIKPGHIASVTTRVSASHLDSEHAGRGSIAKDPTIGAPVDTRTGSLLASESNAGELALPPHSTPTPATKKPVGAPPLLFSADMLSAKAREINSSGAVKGRTEGTTTSQPARRGGPHAPKLTEGDTITAPAPGEKGPPKPGISPDMLKGATLRHVDRTPTDGVGKGDTATRPAPGEKGPPKPGITLDMIRGTTLRHVEGAPSDDAGTRDAARLPSKAPTKGGFKPEDALKVTLRPSGDRTRPAPAPEKKEMTELQRRLAARRALDGTTPPASPTDEPEH